MTMHYGKRPERLAIFAMVISLLLLFGGMMEEYTSKALVFRPVWISGVVALLASLISWGRCYFLRRSVEEETELKDYLSREGRSDLFDDTDEAVRLARRASAQYVKYVVSFFAITLGIGLIVVAWALIKKNQGLVDNASLPIPQGVLSVVPLAIFGVLAALGAGGYYTGASRERGQRWLRPIGAWFLYSSFAYFLSAVALGLTKAFQWPMADVRIAQFLLYTLLVLGIEQLVGLIIEFYRPRSPGEEERPLYESRLLALFTEPGSVAQNLAQSLDYQFGFQVSEGWFYRTLERILVPSAIFLSVTLWLLTCIVQVNPHEQGLRYTFGKISAEPLLPRHCPYFKLPYPLGRIDKYPVKSIQHFMIGEYDMDLKANEKEDINESMVLWSKTHERKEIPFIVANRSHGKPEEDSKDGVPIDDETKIKVPVSAYYLSAKIPVSFRIKDLYLYKCRHSNPNQLLEGLASREVFQYLARTDFNDIIPSENVADDIAKEIMDHGPAAVQRTLLESKLHQMADEVMSRIQKAADGAELGVEITFIGLQEMHPPVETGQSFDAMVGARIQKENLIQQARVDEIQRQYLAEAEATIIKTRAQAYSNSVATIATAEAQRFAGQQECFAAAPKVYKINQFLEVLENNLGSVRKYIIATQGGKETLIFNLEEKIRGGLTDIDVNAIQYGGGQ